MVVLLGHAVVNDLGLSKITSCFRCAKFSAMKEPPDLSIADGKDPYRLMLIPWVNGRNLIWNVPQLIHCLLFLFHRWSRGVGGMLENIQINPLLRKQQHFC